MFSRTIAAVVPTCRGFTIPEQLTDVHWYIVHDREQWPVVNVQGAKVSHIVAPDVEMYGHYCDSIRSAGFLRAVLDKHDYILSVDDDCIIPPDWAMEHVRALSGGVPVWAKTHPHVAVRGMPTHATYKPVAVSHGLWDGVPDLAGRKQFELGKDVYWRAGDGRWRTITAPFPQCAMNFGFPHEAAMVMYQPMQGPTTPFDRFADIWGGLFAQRCLDLHGYGFKNGGAVVYHARASDAEANINKEAAGLQVHDELCEYVWNFDAREDTLRDTYMALAGHVKEFPYEGVYFHQLAENMCAWTGACHVADVRAAQ